MTTLQRTPRLPVVLVILDGWGIGQDYPGNAVLAANTPTMDNLTSSYPTTQLLTSGKAVGLPEGQMGNSEVGHLNIGAGFVVYQWISRIDGAIEDESFLKNEALQTAIDHARDHGGILHLVGLIGEGGVHSHSRHLIALIEMAAARGLKRIDVHAITDGRDTAPNSGLGFVRDVQDRMQRLGVGRVATVSGRYYAMDRDKRWERTEKAYDAIVSSAGPRFTSAGAAIEASYRDGITDEFILPTVIEPPGSVYPGMQANDAMVFFNFRSDRGRQLTQAVAEPDFSGFERSRTVAADVPVTTLTRYQEGLPVAVAFLPQDVEQPLAAVVAAAGLKQYHSAETEKYAHVTFFINGGREDPFPGEDRRMSQSPKVATYDLQPEMSADDVADGVVAAIESGDYALIVVNFANGDMVGHTGVFEAAVKAIETVDRHLGRIIDALTVAGGVAIVTADHGNSEEMLNLETGAVMTAHTTNPVPCVLVVPEDDPLRRTTLRAGAPLSTLAPTILDLLGLERPAAMTTPGLLDSDG